MFGLKNKRRFPRIYLRAPIRYQIRGKPEFGHAVCDNISAGGMGFISEQFIPTLTPLMLEIDVLSRILRPVGKVAWSTTLPHSNRNRLGIEFIELNNIERDYLSDYINMRLGRNITNGI